MTLQLVRRAAGRSGSFLRPKHQILFTLTATTTSLFDIDKKSGYKKDEKPKKEHYIKAAKAFKGELKMLRKEVSDILHLRHFDKWNTGHGSYEYMWKFDGPNTIKDWTVTADSDNLQGKSTANMSISKNNKALFHGYLCQEIPKDGILKNAGYCNIQSPAKLMSFRRQQSIDWGGYTHLVMRIRGDGRPYYINLIMERTFDVAWCDQFNYNLYTRGGPYWQIAKIPFSKFFFSHKGRNQDKQMPPDLQNVNHLGITIADKAEGPFQLEIDYIAVMKDLNHTELSAYESYHHDF